MSYKLSKDRSVAVATDYYWEPDMKTCPRGVKVQLLGAGGVAVYSTYDGSDFWKAWAPLPRVRSVVPVCVEELEASKLDWALLIWALSFVLALASAFLIFSGSMQ